MSSNMFLYAHKFLIHFSNLLMNALNYFQMHLMFQIYELQIHLVVNKIKYTIMLS
jgi:hypothetical protein